MQQTIAALLALIMSLVFGTEIPGNPENTPVAEQRGNQTGSQISEMAKNMEKNGVDNEQGEDGNQNQEQEKNQNGDTNRNHYADEKVPAYNTKSEKVMPALIPQVAVDKSPSLEEYPEGNGQEPDPENGNDQEGTLNQTQAQFGLSVANNQPDEAKENKKAFGEETSQNAQNEGKRP